ncbi:hypothetical protein AB0I60_27070 [Actinosynnema sp. NPDC050436]|uniref:hypothetical protein n=1 Tax=Actinosynnema sp. NPDC050436 TaxID=3155659 RepID=UPI0033DAAC3E
MDGTRDLASVKRVVALASGVRSTAVNDEFVRSVLVHDYGPAGSTEPGAQFRSPRGTALSRNRFALRRALVRAGVPVPRFRLFDGDEDPRRVLEDLGGSVAVRPVTGGTTGEARRARHPAGLCAAHRSLTASARAAVVGAVWPLVNPGGRLLDATRHVLVDADLDGPVFEVTVGASAGKAAVEGVARVVRDPDTGTAIGFAGPVTTCSGDLARAALDAVAVLEPRTCRARVWVVLAGRCTPVVDLGLTGAAGPRSTAELLLPVGTSGLPPLPAAQPAVVSARVAIDPGDLVLGHPPGASLRVAVAGEHDERSLLALHRELRSTLCRPTASPESGTTAGRCAPLTSDVGVADGVTPTSADDRPQPRSLVDPLPREDCEHPPTAPLPVAQVSQADGAAQPAATRPVPVQVSRPCASWD